MCANGTGDLLVNDFKIPTWAGKPPPGLHLDVVKDGKFLQKLIIDEKSYYFFGRNRQLCDFSVEHQSCSRVHSVLVWHKFLSRAFLIDLGSVHGTYIGKIKLEPQKPQQVPIDSELHFGASTRLYILRERPNPTFGPASAPESATANSNGLEHRLSDGHVDLSSKSLGLGTNYAQQLPQSEVELDNLTEFNTAHNRRVASVIDVANTKPVGGGSSKQRGKLNVHFNDADEVINPEDVDPSIGKFRNLIQETFIPNKRSKGSHEGANLGIAAPNQADSFKPALNMNSQTAMSHTAATFGGPGYSLAAKLGLPLPNLAPNVENEMEGPSLPPTLTMLHAQLHLSSSKTKLGVADVLNSRGDTTLDSDLMDTGLVDSNLPRKKKYAKEAWPGKRPGFLVGPTV